MGLSAQSVGLFPAGYFRIFAQAPPMTSPVEITWLRGAPVQINSLTTNDPFGPGQLVLSLPQVTMFDRPGTGDLDWLVPYANIDVIWHNVGDSTFAWSWEGFIIDESMTLTGSDSTMTLECKGALYQLDNYLAKPTFPAQPIPYEILLRDALDPATHPGLRTRKMIGPVFPADWKKLVPKFNQPDYLWFLKPLGVSPGQPWTGLVARATGGWDPTLTGFVQGLLSVMYDDGGSQWTLRMDKGRQPVLYLRRPPTPDDPGVLVVDLGTPGIEVSISRDFTQAANVIYGSGQDNSGTAFSGMVISNSGLSTTYEPFAASKSVYPDSTNPAFNPAIMRRETRMQFSQGMDELTCRELAISQLQRFADPGYTGTITLRTDPYQREDNATFPRMLVTANTSILVRGMRGSNDGVMFHITESSVDFETGTTTLTVDSKYRDALTVEEVRARTRDSLTPLRMLQTGQLSVTVNDLLKPWSYQDGSGMFPRPAREFFLNRIPETASFPYESWTKKYPPKNPDSAKFYIKIDPARTNRGQAKLNWAVAVPVYMAQQGTVRLTQIAAYDKDGNVSPVRFHVGAFYNKGITVTDMPRISSATQRVRQPTHGGTFGYNPGPPPTGDITPFFEGAFEPIRPDGSEYESPFDVLPTGADMKVGWGTYYEPAGYSPGLFSRGAPRTGMLIDEATWDFDTSQYNGFNRYDRADNLQNKDAGMMYLMIYCDDHSTVEPVYFMGRFWRQEPGGIGG